MMHNLSWYHVKKGQYFTDTRKVGIDFMGGVHDGEHAFATLVHETTHVFLCNNTEVGIFSQDVEKHIDQMSSIPAKYKREYMRRIFKAQQAVQEGFATFFQFGVLRKHMTSSEQTAWLHRLPEEYREWLTPFLFTFSLEQEERDLLTTHLIPLTMNTHIRKDAQYFKLLEDFDALRRYLALPDNNPSHRLKAILKAIRKNPKILKLPQDKISAACGLAHFAPIGKQAISDFIYYVSSKAGSPTRLSVSEIGDAMSVESTFEYVQDNTIVANLNMDFKDAEFLYSSRDVEYLSSNIATVLVGERGKNTEREIEILRPKFDEEPEVTFMMQASTGEKYVHLTSKVKAVEFLNNSLKDSVLAVKLGDYDHTNDSIEWLNGCRSPNLVIFNHHWQLEHFLTYLIKKDSSTQIEYCHIGSVEDSPFRSFMCTVNGLSPVFGVNTMIPRQIDSITKSIEGHSAVSARDFVSKHEKVLNSWFISWTGWDLRINWVKTMLDGENLHFIVHP